jgi:hypothetical protein
MCAMYGHVSEHCYRENSTRNGAVVRISSVVCAAIGVVFTLLLLGTIFGNSDLATPGLTFVFDLLPGSWRLFVGPFTLLAAVFFAAAWITFRGLPGLSWLAFLVFVILLIPYLVVPGLMTTGAALTVTSAILVIGVPIGVGAIASAIGRAVARRRASAQGSTPQ